MDQKDVPSYTNHWPSRMLRGRQGRCAACGGTHILSIGNPLGMDLIYGMFLLCLQGCAQQKTRQRGSFVESMAQFAQSIAQVPILARVANLKAMTKQPIRVELCQLPNFGGHRTARFSTWEAHEGEPMQPGYLLPWAGGMLGGGNR